MATGTIAQKVQDPGNVIRRIKRAQRRVNEDFGLSRMGNEKRGGVLLSADTHTHIHTHTSSSRGEKVAWRGRSIFLFSRSHKLVILHKGYVQFFVVSTFTLPYPVLDGHPLVSVPFFPPVYLARN